MAKRSPLLGPSCARGPRWDPLQADVVFDISLVARTTGTTNSKRYLRPTVPTPREQEKAILLTYALIPDGRVSAAEPRTAPSRETVIEAAIDLRRPRIELRTRADKDGLPLIRQALRALGQASGAGSGALHDAELALTEACANAVLHAYDDDEGAVEVTIELRPTELLATVRDHGRGMPPRNAAPAAGAIGGLGLSLIEAVARDVEVRTQPHGGTEVVMTLQASADLTATKAEGSSPAEGSPVEGVVRRLTAMAAAQADLTHERITDALLAAELVTHHASRRVVGDVLRARIERGGGGLQLAIGPLEPDGGAAVLRDTEVPVLGPVVEQLAQGVRAAPEADGSEELVLHFAA
jgi:serine/threonine-protein kinase RsbW